MKKNYVLFRYKGKDTIRMNSTRDIGLFNAICAESGAIQLITPNNTRALPQRLARTQRPVSYATAKGEVYNLSAGSYIAAYNTPESDKINGLYYVAPITEENVQELKKRAEKLGVPFGKKNHPDLFALPPLKVSEIAFDTLLLSKEARLIYKSPSDKTPLIKLIEILPKKGRDTISLYVEDTRGKKKSFSQKIYPGQVLALARHPNGASTLLCFIMPEDCAGIIAQNRLMCQRMGIQAHTLAPIRRVRRCLSRIAKDSVSKIKQRS